MAAAPIKVLLTKPTQDCHDRGVRHLARRLRDAGLEVIFTNFLVAADVVATAVQEDVDVVGVSSSSGGHMPVFEELLAGLAEAGLNDVVVIAGGTIPPADARALKEWGVAGVFGPGTGAEAVVDFIRAEVPSRSEAWQ